jgi:hypothetical protein
LFADYRSKIKFALKSNKKEYLANAWVINDFGSIKEDEYSFKKFNILFYMLACITYELILSNKKNISQQFLE